MLRKITPERVVELLVDLREDLDLEVKNWLDLKGNNEDKATFAKAALALANHGGGFIVLGFEETGKGMAEAANRPATLERYNQDLINGIVQNYCDPPFHCAVHLVPNPKGATFPVVKIPGGHRVPVRARRAGPDENIVQLNAIYVRKPGPRSEPPQSGQEWEDLLSRCLGNRRDEMLGYIRGLLTGARMPQVEPAADEERLERWMTASFDRWSALIDPLPADVGPRFPHGYHNFAYEIVGDARQTMLAQLPDVIRASAVRYTGWPPFSYPTREGIEPYPIDGAVECWLGGDTERPIERLDAHHSDFWRITPDGCAYLLRGYQEDRGNLECAGRGTVVPGKVFSVTLPVWHLGETLLQAERLAANLFEGPTTIRFANSRTDRESTGNPRRSVHQRSSSLYPRTIRTTTVIRVSCTVRVIGIFMFGVAYVEPATSTTFIVRCCCKRVIIEYQRRLKTSNSLECACAFYLFIRAPRT